MKRLLITSTATILVVGVVGAVANFSQPAVTGADSSPIVQQLANHEARITNLEAKVNDQNNGTTTPSVPVPGVTSPSVSDSDVINASTIPANAVTATTPEETTDDNVLNVNNNPVPAVEVPITWQESPAN